MSLRWLPVLAGSAYVATVVALGPAAHAKQQHGTPTCRVHSHSPSGCAAAARCTSPTTANGPRLWWLLNVGLPWHASSGRPLVTAWRSSAATARLGNRGASPGRWAGITAGAAALVVGPFVLRAFLSTLGGHVAPIRSAAVLLAACSCS